LSLVDRKLPPVTEVGAVAMIAIAVGLIYNASYLPKHAQTGVAIAILVVAGLLEVANAVMLSRLRDFAWDRFRQVAGWALLAYAVIAGMIEYAFVYDHTRGTQLAILTVTLVLFMLNVPVLIAFTVARYQQSGTPAAA
jgi:hypothetical protein